MKTSFYPWFIAGFACMTLMVSNGMSITGLPVYDEHLIAEFGWGRGELKFRDMMTFMVTAASAPFIGVLLDRFGVRRCMLVGWVILVIAYYFYSQLASLPGLYSIHVLLGMVLVVCGLNAAVILVSHWFVAKRGTAIGIALVGSSLGGALLPQYGTFMIGELGWRGALSSAMVFPALMLLATFFWVSNRPEDKGMHAVGANDPAVNETAEESGELPGVAYLDALKTRTFWALGLIAMTTFYTVLGAQAHLFLHMRDLAFEPAVATNAISLLFFCALCGKFLFGVLADFIDHKKVFFGNLLIMVSGAVCLALMQVELVWIAVMAFGLGWGGVYTILQLTVMESFGLKAAGKILGTITIMDALGGGLGIWLTGVLYSTFGSYDIAFRIFVVLICIAIVSATQIRPVMQAPAPVHQPS